MPQNDVQVNLIVDPHAFGRQDEESEESEDGDWEGRRGREWDGSVVGGGEFDDGSRSNASGGRKKRKRPPKRRSVFAGLAMEEEWKRARAWAKKVAMFDVLGVILWGAMFIYILLGKRCPSGGFEGW